MSANRKPALPQAPARIAVLITAYQPGRPLECLVEKLTEAGVPAIVVIDDGSKPESTRSFRCISAYPTVHVHRHSRVEGKGFALKTGMNYLLQHFGHYTGVVTASADGQHNAEDILRVARALDKAPSLTILGARNFESSYPEKPGYQVSRGVALANRAMIFLLRACTGLPLSDAQSGLRALPMSLVPGLLALPGNRYEYEMQVLLHLARTGHPLAEQPIRTLRGAGVADPDFRAITDTWRILRVLFGTQPTEVAGVEAAPAPGSGSGRTKSGAIGTLHRG